MSNIVKHALREIAEAAVGAHERLSVMPPDDIFDISLAEGTQLDADITALNALNSAANPTTVLALLDELEAVNRLNIQLQQKCEIDPRTHQIIDLEERITEQRETLLAARRYVMQCARWGDAHANGVLQAIDRAAAGKGE
ncbi:hypothetical protein WP8W19C02_10280 [Enterobacter cloacae]|nr:hypothetical protein WP8W19C02_10280 [Enterobacter cloacae]